MLQIMESPGLSEQLKYKMKVYFWKMETSQSKCGENENSCFIIAENSTLKYIYIYIDI